jgi:hypothetical protein
MNFIEQIFRISPDSGSGTLEAVCLLLIIVPVAYVVARGFMRGRPKHATL